MLKPTSAFRLTLALALFTVSVEAANILQFCNTVDYTGGSGALLCSRTNTFLVNEGHTVTFIDSVQLTSADFIGTEVLWDSSQQTNSQLPECGNSWGGTTEAAVLAFLNSGGSYIFHTENNNLGLGFRQNI